jgi:protein tyrosine/serine phosphatase
MRPRLLALLAVLLVGSGSLGCSRVLYNFGVVERDHIYRSAQPSPLFLRWLVRYHGVRSLINLRGRTDGFESAFAAERGLRLYTFDLSASRPPSLTDVERFLAILDDPANHPVLVHCRNGVDRTGYMLALHRVRDESWSPDRAAREMNRFWQFSLLNPVPQRVVKEGLRGD